MGVSRTIAVAGQTILLDGTGSRSTVAGATIEAYQWSVTAPQGQFTLDGPSAELLLSDPGAYSIVLTVTDSTQVSASSAPTDVRVKGWSAVAPLAVGDLSAESGVIAAAGDGRALAVWVADGTAVHASTYDPVQGWAGAPAVLDGGSGNPAGQLSADARVVGGVLHGVVVWRQSDGVSDSVYAAEFDGASWGGPTQIDSREERVAIPSVRMDSAGNALAVWEQFEGAVRILPYNRFVSGVGWTFPASPVISNLEARSPRLAAEAAGEAVVVWEQPAGPAGAEVRSIYASRYDAGAEQWAAAQLLEADDGNRASAPDVALNGSGSSLVVWQQARPGETEDSIFGARWNALDPVPAWEGPQSVGLPAMVGGAGDPRVAMDPEGNGLAVWTQFAVDPATLQVDAVNSIYASRFDAAAGQWGTPVLVDRDPSGAGTQTRPKVALDGDGIYVILWQEEGAILPTAAIKAAYFDPVLGRASAPQVLATAADAVFEGPRMACDEAGRTFALWSLLDTVSWAVLR